MERVLRNRLIFGSSMFFVLCGLLWLDSFVQRWTQAHNYNSFTENGPAAGVGGVGLLILLLIALPGGTVELATLFAAEKVAPYRLISATGSSLLVIHAFCMQFRKFQLYSTSTLAMIIVMVMLITALRRAMLKQTQEAITHMAGTILATMYLGGLAWFLMALRVKHSAHVDHYNGSTMILIMILFCVKGTDVGAYFGGRAMGKTKLIPWLSPGKTREGLAFGLAFAGLMGASLAPWINPPDFHLQWWKGIIFGIVLGFIGQAGDLLESLMKRDAGLKDSGSLIPGFGGILDVIDSPLMAAPFAYILFSLF